MLRTAAQLGPLCKRCLYKGMNMGNLLFFIVVIFSVSLKANANTSEALKNASDIAQALAISELSTNGAALSFERRFPKTPAAKTTIDCFKRDYRPKAHVYFTQLISQSLDNKTLAEGVSLANRDAVNKNYEFILNNSEHLKSKAKANKKRLDSYVLIEAAKHMTSKTDKADLLAFSRWVESNGPIFSKVMGANVKTQIDQMSESLESCMP